MSDCLDIPDELRPYFKDYGINVFEIAYLPDETIQKFHSDFRIVADYFSQIRKNNDYQPSNEEITHVDAVLKLMSVMTGDKRFEEVQKTGESEVHTMCELLDRIEQQGIQQGMQQGEINLANAIRRLCSGETKEQLIAIGLDARTVDLALTLQMSIPM